MSVDTSFRNNTARSLNAINLHLVLRFMIETERDNVTTFAQDASRVSSVGHVDFVLRIVDHDDIGCAANRVES